jgi:ribose/xylose/arabinose/galactoside ABC-type transport system permease subunit
MLLHNFSSGAQQLTTGALLLLTVIVMHSVRRQTA